MSESAPNDACARTSHAEAHSGRQLEPDGSIDPPSRYASVIEPDSFILEPPASHSPTYVERAVSAFDLPALPGRNEQTDASTQTAGGLIASQARILPAASGPSVFGPESHFIDVGDSDDDAEEDVYLPSGEPPAGCTRHAHGRMHPGCWMRA